MIPLIYYLICCKWILIGHIYDAIAHKWKILMHCNPEYDISKSGFKLPIDK